VERAYFFFSRALGRMLRAGRYSTTRIVRRDGELEVRKSRRFYAPLLVWMGRAVVRILDTGTLVLPQREWEERERELYLRLYGSAAGVGPGGVLLLPCLAGRTLAALLEDPALSQPLRERAVDLAVDALAALHRQGVTHADAMAENVMVDLEAGMARWFDFETVHEASRPELWRRADDLRALLATCLLRTDPEQRAGTLQHTLDRYADHEVTRMLVSSMTTVWRRPLAFHLGQAGFSYGEFREIALLLTERVSP
jgi:hypothetical protein